MNVPAQPGLSFHINFHFQNIDELHLFGSALWVEWFPCTNPKKVDEYFDAVSGLLSGQFRILEYWRGSRSVKAKLQRPSNGGRETIKTWSVLLSIPWPPKSSKVVQNLPSIEPVL